jgi:hypothetical protein
VGVTWPQPVTSFALFGRPSVALRQPAAEPDSPQWVRKVPLLKRLHDWWWLAALSALTLPAFMPGQTDRGRMILSGQNSALAIHAWGGAGDGTVLRLSNGCRSDNLDCTWIYRDGMLLSGRNPRLAINASGGARHGTVLALSSQCRPANPDCVWRFERAMFLSARDPTLAINAWNGAVHGTVLRLHNGCRPTNGHCTWRFRP